MFRTQDLQDALSQVESYVESITEMATNIKDKSESYHDDLSRGELETLLDEINELSKGILSEIK